jgi:hypothetical protein
MHFEDDQVDKPASIGNVRFGSLAALWAYSSLTAAFGRNTVITILLIGVEYSLNFTQFRSLSQRQHQQDSGLIVLLAIRYHCRKIIVRRADDPATRNS